MFYKVFLDPATFIEAYEGGEHALSNLTGLLELFLVNCVVAEVDGWMVHQGISDSLAEIGTKFQREIEENGEESEGSLNGDYIARLKKLLVTFEKRKRFIDTLSTSVADELLPIIAFSKGTREQIDFILTSSPKPLEIGAAPESSNLAGFLLSAFKTEQKRGMDGGLLKAGDHTSENFFTTVFRSIFDYTRSVVIVDKLLGEKFGDNFKYTLKRLVNHLRASNSFGAEFNLTIHTSGNARLQNMEDEILQWWPGLNLTINTYEKLCHERYLFTDQFGVQLGIGCDLLDKITGLNRTTDLSYAKSTKLDSILSSN